jgi:integrase
MRKLIWNFYADLKLYRVNPGKSRRLALRARLDRIFRRRTGFATLDRLLKRPHANKAELLMVLERPEIPLHANGSEHDIRCHWADVIKIAKLPGVTRHTLRHTLGSTATSSGEALALTGAILGHANLRATAIYAHVQHDPSMEAAKRVEKLLATALEGRAAQSKDGDSADDVPEPDADLIRVLAERLSKEGSDTARLRAIIAQVVALNT